jgi:hypothetical protein
MPFDDLKTLPEGFGTTPTMQPVAWAVTGSPQGLVHLCDSYELADSVACGQRRKTGQDHRIRPLVYGDRPVAVPAVPRHDAATCCGERQVPDVGEVWRELGADEVLQEGDEVLHRGWWKPALSAGTLNHRYRRRVTPAVQVESMSITDTWAAEVARLSAENHLLTAEVERLRQQVAMLKPEVTLLGNACEAYTTEIVRLRSEVERLRLTPEQVAAIDYSISKILDHDWYGGPEPERVVALRSLLARHGGGE